MSTESTVTADQALQLLVEGNARFVAGKLQHPHQDAGRRAEVLAGQHPFAIILSCSDSRVPVEELFDQGIGDLFLIRNAGNILDDVVLGSIEYAAEHIGVPLLLILGHTKCGAVTATCGGGEAPGHIKAVVEIIAPAVEEVRGHAGDFVMNATVANVKRSVDQARNCGPILSHLVKEGKLQVVGGIYHLDTGKVELF